MARRRPGLAAMICCVLAGCAQTAGTPANVVIGARPPKPIEAPWLYDTDPPKIERIWLSERDFHAHDLARVRVTTTTNAASVEARIESYGRALRRASAGQFVGALRVPTLPPFLRRSFALRFIVRNSLGISTQEAVEVQLR
ncbi:MAG: hypothetical protein ACREJX_02985 [Polyangiaceae bacterium]